MTKIVLDAEVFKVLASDTRLSILKSLDLRPKTVSELSRELGLNKATVFEHLQQLVTGDLIKKNERAGRKWVYYALSWKGKSLLHPENTTVLVLLSMGLLGSTAALLQLGNYLKWWGLSALTGASDGNEDGADKAGPTGLDDSSANDSPEGAGAPASQDNAALAASETAGNDTVEADAGTAKDSAASGGFFDFADDTGFWIFALFLLAATALITMALVVKSRARQRPSPLAAVKLPPAAEVGAPKTHAQAEADATHDLKAESPDDKS